MIALEVREILDEKRELEEARGKTPAAGTPVIAAAPVKLVEDLHSAGPEALEVLKKRDEAMRKLRASRHAAPAGLNPLSPKATSSEVST